jgi:hypothetical protein
MSRAFPNSHRWNLVTLSLFYPSSIFPSLRFLSFFGNLPVAFPLIHPSRSLGRPLFITRSDRQFALYFPFFVQVCVLVFHRFFMSPSMTCRFTFSFLYRRGVSSPDLLISWSTIFFLYSLRRTFIRWSHRFFPSSKTAYRYHVPMIVIISLLAVPNVWSSKVEHALRLSRLRTCGYVCPRNLHNATRFDSA